MTPARAPTATAPSALDRISTIRWLLAGSHLVSDQTVIDVLRQLGVIESLLAADAALPTFTQEDVDLLRNLVRHYSVDYRTGAVIRESNEESWKGRVDEIADKLNTHVRHAEHKP